MLCWLAERTVLWLALAAVRGSAGLGVIQVCYFSNSSTSGLFGMSKCQDVVILVRVVGSRPRLAGGCRQRLNMCTCISPTIVCF